MKRATLLPDDLFRPWLAATVLVASLCTQAAAQLTSLISATPAGATGNGRSTKPAISADGLWVAFQSKASDLWPGDSNGVGDVFARDVFSGTLALCSISSAGGQANGQSIAAAISGDGRLVGFQSVATNLVVGDTNGLSDCFVHDRATGLTWRVSVDASGAQSDGTSDGVGFSADGRFLCFRSIASNLVPGDTNGSPDIFVVELSAGAIERVSVSSSGAEASPGQGSDRASLSDDGRFVAFDSAATNLVTGDNNGAIDCFVRDRLAGTTIRISTDASGAEANGLSVEATIAQDGRYVAFQSAASNLVPGDTNGVDDVFVKDLHSGAILRANVSSSGLEADGPSLAATISRDGRCVVFFSSATNLVPGDTNLRTDVFLRDLLAPSTSRISVATGGIEGDGNSQFAAVSGDARRIVFDSLASNFASPDLNAAEDVFLSDRGQSYLYPQAYCTGKLNSQGCVPQISATGVPSAAATQGFVISATQVLNHKPGLLLYTVAGPAAIPFQGGTLCLQSPIRRSTSVNSGGSLPPATDCTGIYSIDMSAFTSGALGGTPLLALAQPGTLVFCQWWGRDPGYLAPMNSSLSDALMYRVEP